MLNFIIGYIACLFTIRIIRFFINKQTIDYRDSDNVPIYPDTYFLMKNNTYVHITFVNKDKFEFTTDKNFELTQPPHGFRKQILKEVSQDEYRIAFEKYKFLQHQEKEIQKLVVEELLNKTSISNSKKTKQ